MLLKGLMNFILINQKCSGLDNLKIESDKLDVDNFIPVPIDLSKLSDIVKNKVVIEDVYDELVKKVIDIDTSRLVKKQILMLR